MQRKIHDIDCKVEILRESILTEFLMIIFKKNLKTKTSHKRSIYLPNTKMLIQIGATPLPVLYQNCLNFNTYHFCRRLGKVIKPYFQGLGNEIQLIRTLSIPDKLIFHFKQISIKNLLGMLSPTRNQTSSRLMLPSQTRTSPR